MSEGKSILKSFFSLENILHLVDEDMGWNVERYSVGGMGWGISSNLLKVKDPV